MKFAKIITYKWCLNIFILLLLGLNFVPRILFTVASVYDIFWMHYFEKIYVIIPYLLLPFLAKIILFSLRFTFIGHMAYYNGILIEEENPTGSYYKLHPEMAHKPLPYNIKDLNDLISNHYKILLRLETLLLIYYTVEERLFLIWLTFIMLLVRLICFFTVLFISLHIITPW